MFGTQRMRTFFIFSFLVLVSTSCSLPVYYKSSPISATVVDAYTGQPIEGATIQVRWSALHHKWPEGADSMDIHTATTTTDKNGLFTIPAWGPVGAARKWHYYDFDPMVSFSKTGYKSAYKDNDNNQDSVTSGAIPFLSVTLKSPSWAGNNLELESLDNNAHPISSTNTLSSISDEVLSNSLSYYVVHKNIVENGRYINSTDFLTTGYIRPKPDVLITNIKSFSINLPNDVLNKDWPRPNFHFANTDKQEPYSAFSITLFTKDAQKVARLEWANNGGNDLLFMLGNKPLAANYLSTGKFDKIPIPTNSQTIYLPLREHQDIHEIEQALQKLVQEK